MAKLLNVQAFKDFFRSGQIGGVILLVCVAVSLFIANSSYAPAFSTLLATDFGFTFGTQIYSFTVSAWINDALMAVFFLLVGLEIKREMLEGELFHKESITTCDRCFGRNVGSCFHLFYV